MAIEELGDVANDTYVAGAFVMSWFLTGDALQQCGQVNADHATNDAETIICGTAGVPFGITALQAAVDIDTPIADGIMSSSYTLHAGTVLRVGNDATAAAYFKGTGAITSTTVAGLVEDGTTAGVVVGYSMKTYDAGADKYLELIT